jgi:hypothetical protein
MTSGAQIPQTQGGFVCDGCRAPLIRMSKCRQEYCHQSEIYSHQSATCKTSSQVRDIGYRISCGSQKAPKAYSMKVCLWKITQKNTLNIAQLALNLKNWMKIRNHISPISDLEKCTCDNRNFICKYIISAVIEHGNQYWDFRSFPVFYRYLCKCFKIKKKPGAFASIRFPNSHGSYHEYQCLLVVCRSVHVTSITFNWNAIVY